MPRRIQRKRRNGWRMPDGAVYVGRPTIWGNPWKVGEPSGLFDGRDGRPLGMRDQAEVLIGAVSLAKSIEMYRALVRGHLYPEMFPFGHDWMKRFEKRIGHPMTWLRSDLRGRDLACWCPLDQPCHADVLLDLANA